jgi:hypothetical protein
MSFSVSLHSPPFVPHFFIPNPNFLFSTSNLSHHSSSTGFSSLLATFAALSAAIALRHTMQAGP